MKALLLGPIQLQLEVTLDTSAIINFLPLKTFDEIKYDLNLNMVKEKFSIMGTGLKPTNIIGCTTIDMQLENNLLFPFGKFQAQFMISREVNVVTLNPITTRCKINPCNLCGLNYLDGHSQKCPYDILEQNQDVIMAEAQCEENHQSSYSG